MTSIKTYLNSLGRTTRAVVLALAVIFVSAGIAQAATTISTSITTGGAITTTSTLSVTGLATFLGGATTTQMTLLSGDTIKNTAASTTAISGTVTADANLTLLNAQSATSTLTAGCIIATASSSGTKVKLNFLAVATTSANGFVTWSYGTSCP
ncbi:MAG: hypothetical protein Q7R58_00685 [bacterium]|nr:hypothetical protein [bacterium]